MKQHGAWRTPSLILGGIVLASALGFIAYRAGRSSVVSTAAASPGTSAAAPAQQSASAETASSAQQKLPHALTCATKLTAATKKSAEELPIDPDETAGVRGVGASTTIYVERAGKHVEKARVVVKTENGVDLLGCRTNASGFCRVALSEGDYTVTASDAGEKGSVAAHVGEGSNSAPIVVTLPQAPG